MIRLDYVVRLLSGMKRSSREHIMNFAAQWRRVSINVRVNAATVGDLTVAAGD